MPYGVFYQVPSSTSSSSIGALMKGREFQNGFQVLLMHESLKFREVVYNMVPIPGSLTTSLFTLHHDWVRYSWVKPSRLNKTG